MVGDVDRALSAFVQDLMASGALIPGPTEQAFRAVRRHRFVEHWYRLEARGLQAIWEHVPFDREAPTPDNLAEIYSNTSLVTKLAGLLPTASSSEPALTSLMLDLLDVRKGMRILEVGTGTGYNAALLAELAGDPSLVTTIEIQEDVAADARDVLAHEGYGSIRVIRGDGAYGFPEGAPYDRIEATIGCSDLSPHWLRQLAPGGRVLVPLQHGHLHPLIQIEPNARDSRRAIGRWVGHSAFMAIQGEMAWANPWQDYILRGIPRGGERHRGLPVSFPRTPAKAHPLRSVPHRAFYFFLTLSSRELWQTNEGYGLVDPGGRASALIEDNGIRIQHRPGAEACGDRLADRLAELLELWDRYGRPNPDTYEIEFVPKDEIPDLGACLGPQWVIERVYFWQVTRLSDALPSDSDRRTPARG